MGWDYKVLDVVREGEYQRIVEDGVFSQTFTGKHDAWHPEKFLRALDEQGWELFTVFRTDAFSLENKTIAERYILRRARK